MAGVFILGVADIQLGKHSHAHGQSFRIQQILLGIDFVHFGRVFHHAHQIPGHLGAEIPPFFFKQKAVVIVIIAAAKFQAGQHRHQRSFGFIGSGTFFIH